MLPTTPASTTGENDKLMNVNKLFYLIDEHELLVCATLFSGIVSEIVRTQIEYVDVLTNILQFILWNNYVVLAKRSGAIVRTTQSNQSDVSTHGLHCCKMQELKCVGNDRMLQMDFQNQVT